jgi:predicted amidohydrolase
MGLSALCRVVPVAILVLSAGCRSPQPCADRATEANVSLSTTGHTIRIAGIVLKWVDADKDRNYARAEPLIRQAAQRGAQIVVTTECFLDGYAIRDKTLPLDTWRALGEPIPDGAYVRRLCRLAAELRIHLMAGLLEREGDATFNTAILISPEGRIIGTYRKHDLGHESVRNTPGTTFPVFETQHGKIGIMICADRRNAGLVRQLKDNGADLLICPSGGMWGPEKNDHFLQARSRETGLPIIFVHPIEFLVTGPDGAILERRFAGDVMSLDTGGIGSPADVNEVAMFDLEVRR